MNRISSIWMVGLVLSLTIPSVWAQNTGGVFGPVVHEGHQSAEYRIGFDPDSDGLNQRVHFQQSLDTSKMWRIVAQGRKPNGNDFDFDYVQGELFWELTPDDASLQQGLRFDARLRDDDRPGFIGANWMTQFRIADNWRVRTIVLTSVDVGNNARDGLYIQTRGQLSRSLAKGKRVGLELFSAYGAIDDIPELGEQRHQLGPFVTTPFAEGFSLYAGALFGLTDASPDTNIALWVTKRF